MHTVKPVVKGKMNKYQIPEDNFPALNLNQFHPVSLFQTATVQLLLISNSVV